MKAFPLIGSLLVLLAAPRAHAVDITECFQEVPHGEVGELMNDLVCVGSGGLRGGNVYLGVGAELRLNGHSISGGTVGVMTNASTMPTRITGPGEIAGASACAVSVSMPLRIENVTLRDSGCGLLRIYNQAVRLRDVTITGNAGDGISSHLTSPGRGKIAAKNLTISDNDGDGIRSIGAAKLERATVTGNGGGGVILDSARPAKILNGTLTGNGSDGDLAAREAPRLVATTCGNSVDLDDGGTLGVCTND